MNYLCYFLKIHCIQDIFSNFKKLTQELKSCNTDVCIYKAEDFFLVTGISVSAVKRIFS